MTGSAIPYDDFHPVAIEQRHRYRRRYQLMDADSLLSHVMLLHLPFGLYPHSQTAPHEPLVCPSIYPFLRSSSLFPSSLIFSASEVAILVRSKPPNHSNQRYESDSHRAIVLSQWCPQGQGQGISLLRAYAGVRLVPADVVFLQHSWKRHRLRAGSI